MSGKKLKLYGQVQILLSWLDDNLESLTELQAEKCLEQISWLWANLERRRTKTGRKASHE